MCLGIPGRVVAPASVENGLAVAPVEFGGVVRKVCTECVPDVREGDYVIVHAGVAISRLDTDEADRLLATLREIAETDGWAET